MTATSASADLLEESQGKQGTVQYLNISSAMRPIPHGGGFPIPETPNEFFNDLKEDQELVSCDVPKCSISSDEFNGDDNILS
ncbi:hypothetical protein AVEN_191101-1 [Araneus ventricosus]|uniref:Uncharacterized protein n=1 Tax=Araneus ventricosus TaxID=182803 RepID=A0A4Y2AX58_ARAVE|nr:hypothetical protein AVEN_191101-1 [Araneus ventricosus]